MNVMGLIAERRYRCSRAGRTSVFTALVASILLLLGTGTQLYAQSETTGSATLLIDAPAQVAKGEVVVLTLRLEGAAEVGGFEAQLLYGRDAGEFAGFKPLMVEGGLSVGQLVVPEMPTGSAVGFYSCSTEPCLNMQQAQAAVAATPGALAQVELLARATGQFEVRLDHVQVVDRQGQRIALAIPQNSVVIQVGESAEALVAPASRWEWAASAAAANTVDTNTVDASAADMTQDGANTHGDVMEVALGWQIMREEGKPCGGSEMAADVNGDGCVDIADVQLASAFANGAFVGSTSAPQSPAGTDDSGQNNQIYIPWAVDSSGAIVYAAAVMTFTVNSAHDNPDAAIGDGICQTASGVCTLRAAIAEANKNPGSDVILFAIPGDGVHTIQLGSRLPTISDESGGILIDGYSQSGATPNSDLLVSNAQILVQIRGNGFDLFDGITITSAGNVIRGVALFNLRRSIHVIGAGAHDNLIVGNFVGTDAAGTARANSTSEQQAHGITLEQGPQNNRIGGVSPAERNIVSGNARHGIGLWHSGTENNLVINNVVGLSPDGTRGLPNRLHGIDINYGASKNTIGGTEPGQRNVISGNNGKGAEISHGAETSENVIIGNFVGTDVTGTSAASYTRNLLYGVSLQDRVTGNLVTDNVIGNNLQGGVSLYTLEICCTSGNTIQRNRIGISLDNRNIANGAYGVQIVAQRTQIGPENIIAYNPVGIQITTSTSVSNTITQNSIFSNTGLGIDLEPVGQANPNDVDDADSGPNMLLNYPLLTHASPQSARGSACAGCLVELFIADQPSLGFGEGKTFIGAGAADTSGAFTIALSLGSFGQYLTATATDANGNTSEFSQNVLVSDPANTPPVAADDVATTRAGEAVAVNVLANDTDAEGDALSVVAVGAAANGTVAQNGSILIYTPAAGFDGVDSFTYTASDSIGGSSVATVTVTVELVPTAEGGVLVAPTVITITEGGPPVPYSVVLESEPTADVTVSVLADARLNLAPTQLLFNAGNWNVPQTVAVSVAASEQMVESFQSGVSHQVSSADSAYNNVGAAAVTVNVIAASGQQEEQTRLLVPLIRR